MVASWRALALLAALHVCAGLPEPVYHNQFAVHVPAGPEHVDDIARRHGFVNHGQVSAVITYRIFFNRVFKLNPTDRVISKLCNHIKTKYNTSVAKHIQLESG